jgi:hypothetical protein
MTEYELTPEQWKKLEWEAQNFPYSLEIALLELRERVQRLEGLIDERGPVKHLDHARKMAEGSLLMRVATAISEGVESFNWEPEASRAIQEVAQWIREHYPSFQGISVALEEEIER